MPTIQPHLAQSQPREKLSARAPASSFRVRGVQSPGPQGRSWALLRRPRWGCWARWAVCVAMASAQSRSFETLKAEDVEPGIGKPASSARVVTDGFDVLTFIDFKWDAVGTAGLRGHFLVTPKICQPFGVLHGGITAFLAENLASMGASVVARWSRVAGIDLNVNHLLSASIGETVHVKATPLRAGKRVQVWDVTFTKPVTPRNASEPQVFATTAVARLTLLVGLPGPETAREGNERLMDIAKSLSSSDEISCLRASKL